MSTDTIQKLFANDISRRIEEVIKVDQADEAIIKDELTEYVVTDSIRGYFNEVFELYAETPQKPHEGIGIWVSGFFGSGKSSFAKNLGLALQNRTIEGEGAGVRLAQRIGDPLHRRGEGQVDRQHFGPHPVLLPQFGSQPLQSRVTPGDQHHIVTVRRKPAGELGPNSGRGTCHHGEGVGRGRGVNRHRKRSPAGQ